MIEKRHDQSLKSASVLNRYGSFTFACLALSSCIVPASFSGYMPRGPGHTEGGYCVVGIRDTLRITEGDVSITVRAGHVDQKRRLTLTVRLFIPAGHTAQFTEPEFQVESEEWESPRTAPIRKITAPGPRQFTATSELPGADESLGTFSVSFGMRERKQNYSETDLPAASAFSLKFPPLRIDGNTRYIEPIYFHAYSKLGAYVCPQ